MSGIKAHTIRIWEKRYNLLEPERSDTNIRQYDLQALQKILNVRYLKDTGVKISTIATLSNEEIEQKVRHLSQSAHSHNYQLQELKLAMVNFDEVLFDKVFNAELERKSFDVLFYDLLVPLLEELGNLWQSNTINVAHEHFVSNIIKQKVLLQIERLKRNQKVKTSQPLILFLPENEMHDLGLLFLNYKLLASGFHTIFLGASMILDTLTFFQLDKLNPAYSLAWHPKTTRETPKLKLV